MSQKPFPTSGILEILSKQAIHGKRIRSPQVKIADPHDVSYGWTKDGAHSHKLPCLAGRVGLNPNSPNIDSPQSTNGARGDPEKCLTNE
jgi:hypothetical protein